MGKIQVLDNNTIDQIAAGEVVERPASVVKELTENAIDAGADAITVEIKNGGIEFIRVTDNGCGIAKEDMETAFLRHATSKIRSIEDLRNVSSMGFRGEALASIASVSKVTMITKTKDSLMGYRLEVDGGDAGQVTEVGAPGGTTIIAAHLFYNVPVRRKFLKSATTEGNVITELMEHLALSRPDISFKLVSNWRNVFYTSGSGDLHNVIYRIYGRDMAKETIAIDYECDGVVIDGYLGTPAVNRPNRNFENYFLNNRYIKNDIVARGLEDGYKGYTMQHKFPFCVLHIDMPAGDVDVNVHPGKMDVRFKDREGMYEHIAKAVAAALHDHEMIPEAEIGRDRKLYRPEVAEAPEPYEAGRRSEFKDMNIAEESDSDTASATDSMATANQLSGIVSDTAETAVSDILTSSDISATCNDSRSSQTEKTSGLTEDREQNDIEASPKLTKDNRDIFTVDFSDDEDVVLQDFSKERAADENYKNTSAAADSRNKTTEDKNPVYHNAVQLEILPKERVISANARKRYELIGPAFNTYWMFTYDGKLYFADQHAAHEKVNYERLIKKYKEREIYKQQLNPPIIVNLSGEEREVLEKFKGYFDELGFEVNNFGGMDYSLNTVPLELYRKDAKTFFMEILNDLCLRGVRETPDIINKIMASVACKSAVKGGDVISREEMDKILDELLTLENPYHCPHGRPTVFSISRTELEKKFKRIVS